MYATLLGENKALLCLMNREKSNHGLAMLRVQESQNIKLAGPLTLWLVISFLVWVFLASPTITPPGNVWRFGHTLTCIIVIVGAYRSTRLNTRRILYFLYGCLAGSFIMNAMLPDSRDMDSIAMGLESLEAYITRSVGFVIALGIVCAIAAQVRLVHLKRARDDGPRTRCEKCGYLLYGLPEPRCPECGAPFEPDETDTDIPSSSDDEYQDYLPP